MRLTLSILLLAFTTAAVAGGPVYRYKDKDGVIHYTDQPPGPGAQPATLPPLQTISPSEPLSEITGSGAPVENPATAAASIALKITSPAPDEVLRGDDRTLTVSASGGPLPEGVGLKYFLDGAAQNSAPVKGFTFTMQNVERGEHSVAVAAIDASGKEVARSASVTVHMKPPTIDNAPKIPKPPTR